MSITPTAEPPPDEALIAQLRCGDPEALGELYQRHAASVRECARHYTHRSADAEDICQEVFLRLPFAIRRYKERGSFKGWLLTVTACQALSWVRRQQRRREYELAEADLVGWCEDDRIEAQLALGSAMTELPNALRLVFVLKEIEGYSHQEIAKQLGIECGASKVRLFRARVLLRQRLGGVAGS